ncbi:MAG: SCO family protein [Rhodobacteraceae bacterium]|nr:SCO family protein [Paracoccaceae bacterium]
MGLRAVTLALSLTLAITGIARAHDGADHAAPTPEKAADPVTPLPFQIGGAFSLIDQTGTPRRAPDPRGQFQLLFFGYANCRSICSVALPMIAETVDLLAANGITATPVMITVDPARDTVSAMGPALARIHPDFIGLTGDRAALDQAYRAFQVESRVVFEDPVDGPVYAHGSHVYLLDPQGTVVTLFPPILSAARAAQIVTRYVTHGG